MSRAAKLEREVQSYWKRLEAWAKEHAPAMLAQLAGPADPAALDALERRLRVELPVDFRASLRVHDGELGALLYGAWCGGGKLNSCAEIVEQWEEALDFAEEPKPEETEELVAEGIFAAVEGPVHAVAFREQWLPWMNLNGDRIWYLDFDPAPGGTPGQVIEVDPECTTWRVVAPSFAEFLRCYVESLESGAFAAIDAKGLPCDDAELQAEAYLEQGRAAALAAFRDCPIRSEDFARLRPGSEVEVVGFVTDSSDGEHYLAIQDGEIPVRGALPDIYQEDDPSLEDVYLRVRLRVGRKRLWRRAIHDVLDWARL